MIKFRHLNLMNEYEMIFIKMNIILIYNFIYNAALMVEESISHG